MSKLIAEFALKILFYIFAIAETQKGQALRLPFLLD